MTERRGGTRSFGLRPQDDRKESPQDDKKERCALRMTKG